MPIIILKGVTARDGYHLGPLDSYFISVSKTSGITVSLSKTTVSKDSAASETVTGTLTVAEGYTLSSVKIMMGDTDKTSAWYNASTGAITISGITANVSITAVATSNSGSDDSGSGDSDSTIVFTNDDFEVGAYDAAGTAVALTTRYRTKATKKFSQDVLITGQILEGDTLPANLRYVTYVNGAATGITDWATTFTIPANTEFNLVMERGAGGDVSRGTIEVTVPAGATKLYINTLKTYKASSYAIVDGTTIDGSAFVDGLYHYGTVGSAKASVTSSSKMAAYNSAIPVSEGTTVTLELFTSATYGYVFTDDNDTIIEIDGGLFGGRNYSPLEFFTYEAQ